jgi:hypothetical protein
MIIGIDPGKKGGVAVLSEKKVELINTPEEPIGMANVISSALNSAYIDNERLTTYIENVHAFPTDARSSAFKFGMNYGMWLGILGAYKIEVKKVSPFKWMEPYKPLPKIKQERKAKLKEIAQELCPDIRVTLRTADAFLIALYGKNNEDYR